MKSALCPVIAALLMGGCATVAPIPPSHSVATTRKSQSDAVTSLVRVLLRDGFVVTQYDPSIGIVRTEPREFKISRGLASVSWPAWAEIQVMIDGSRVDTNIVFRCAYGRTVVSARLEQVCTTGDGEADRAIQVERARIQELIGRAL